MYYTGKGDKGITYPGKVGYRKDDILFELLGTLDECNSMLGIVLTHAWNAGATYTITISLQELLFIMQAEIATVAFGYEIVEEETEFPKITEDHLHWIENKILLLEKDIPHINYFVLPGGTQTASYLDYSRTLMRKAERIAVSYSQQRLLSETIIAVLNRFSSILYVLARYENMIAGKRERKPMYAVE